MAERRLVLIDGHALLYRAFFSFPPSLTLPDGQMVNAAFGFTRMLLSTMAELKPTYLAVSFDVGKTFRHEEFADYKAHREKMPDELKSQEPIVQEILHDLNVPVYSMLNFEADDVIGTVAKQAAQEEEEVKVLIVTGDKDIWQLVEDKIHVYVPGGGRRASVEVDEAAVIERLGVTPEQVPDYKGLAGDGSDNIPGVKGVGPKTAVKLLEKYGTVEQMYEQIEADKERPVSAKILEKLLTDKQMALMSKELATIKTDVPVDFNIEACRLSSYDKTRATATLLKYNFKSLVVSLPIDEFEQEIQEALF